MGVVVSLRNTIRWLEKWGHDVHVLSPLGFRTVPDADHPPEIPLALFPSRKVCATMAELDPDAIHIATEGPLGIAARAWCLRNHRAVHDGVSHLLSRIREAAVRRAARRDLRLAAPLPRSVLGDPRGDSRHQGAAWNARDSATSWTGRAA